MVEFPEQVSEKVRDVVLFLTYKSTRPLSARRIQKLAYLAELRAIEKLGRRLTDADFINYKHGPWSLEVALAAEEAPELQMSKEETPKGIGRFFSPAQNKAKIHALGKEEIDLLHAFVADWIRVDTDALVKAAKTSPPFIWTANLRDPIPFEEYGNFVKSFKEAKADKLGNVTVLDTKSAVESFVKSLS